MGLPVALTDIIDAMQMESDMIHHFLNRKTGEIILVTDEIASAVEYEDLDLEEYPEWEQESILQYREILMDEDNVYVEFPSQYDFREWDMMASFAEQIEDEKIREILLVALDGKGAFRRFKDVIHRYGLAEEWYSFKNYAFKLKAIEWCEKNGIPYIDE